MNELHFPEHRPWWRAWLPGRPCCCGRRRCPDLQEQERAREAAKQARRLADLRLYDQDFEARQW